MPVHKLLKCLLDMFLLTVLNSFIYLNYMTWLNVTLIVWLLTMWVWGFGSLTCMTLFGLFYIFLPFLFPAFADSEGKTGIVSHQTNRTGKLFQTAGLRFYISAQYFIINTYILCIFSFCNWTVKSPDRSDKRLRVCDWCDFRMKTKLKNRWRTALLIWLVMKMMTKNIL